MFIYFIMASNSAATTLIPKVVKFGFIDYKIDKKSGSATAVCYSQFCKSKTSITEKIGTTSNFVRHLSCQYDAE